jgi:hypothetical protein
MKKQLHALLDEEIFSALDALACDRYTTRTGVLIQLILEAAKRRARASMEKVQEAEPKRKT